MKRPRNVAELLLNRWVMGAIAKQARESCPDVVAAFSAFLSEIATVPWLRRYLP